MIWLFWDFSNRLCNFLCNFSLRKGDLEGFREVGGDGEGVLLLEWHVDLDLLAIQSQALLLVPKMLNPRNSLLQQGGKPPGSDLGWQFLIRLV